MPVAELKDVKTTVSRDGKDFVVEVRVPGKVQSVGGKTLRAAMLAAADLISALTGEA